MTMDKQLPVAVWLMDGDHYNEDVPDPIRLLRVVAKINDGDFEFACRVAEGTDKGSSRPWKGVIAGPVTPEAAEVIVKWIEAEGGHASIDDGFFEDEDVDGEGESA